MRTGVLIAAAALSSCGGRVSTVGNENGPAPTSGAAGASTGRSGSGGGASGGRGAMHRTGGASGQVPGDAGTAAGGSSQTFPPGFPAASRTLKSLDKNEARKLCLEDARRSDPCMLSAMQTKAEAACNAQVSACRAALEPGQTDASCDTPVDMSRCDVTVEQYFDCLDTWNGLYVCANAGLYIATPEACKAVSECMLSDQGNQAFMQLGGAAPCAPDSPPRPPDTNDDIYGLDPCPPIPTRMIALGNSIDACEDTPTCAPFAIASYIREHYSPSLAYENHAAYSSDLVDLLRQAKLGETGAGHTAVYIFALPTDVDTRRFDLWKSQLSAVFDYFTDSSRFPDGATFLVNTQYSPSDQCPVAAPPFFNAPLTPEQEGLLRDINQMLYIDPGVTRADAVTVDQYPDWLGHGANANVKGCPYCSTDNTAWQFDPVHPNQAGNQHIFEKWKVAVDRMYGSSCKP